MAPPRKIRTWCTVEGCESMSKYGDLCGKHYKRQWRYGNPTETKIIMDHGGVCFIEGCNEPYASSGLCTTHYARWKRAGRTTLIRNENGTGTVTAGGYRQLTVDGRREYEHILVAEKALGKPLPPKAVVHHVTENRLDNHGPFKLVICPDQAYHLLIHRLMREKNISFKYGWPNEDVDD